jgi:hypothetical protein
LSLTTVAAGPGFDVAGRPYNKTQRRKKRIELLSRKDGEVKRKAVLA